MASVKIRLHPRQQEAFKHLRDKSVHTVLFGGAIAGGKTRLLVTFILWSALTYAGTRYLIGRKRLTDLRASTLRTFFDVAKEMGIEGAYNYNQQLNTITLPNGSEILLRQLDVKPSDPDMVELGSMELTAAAVDEIGEIDEVVYTTLLQRLRYKLEPNGITGKILLVSNPTKNWAYRKIFCKHEDGSLSPSVRYVHCLPQDNPFNSPSYLATLTEENLGTDAYNSRVLGDWHYEIGDSDLFSETDILNAFNWSLEGVDQRNKYLTVDVATKSGSDSTVVFLWNGLVCSRCWKWKGKDTLELYALIKDIIAQERVPMNNVIVDAIGVGQGLSDLLRGSVAYKANHSRLNDEGYQSQRDQLYYKAAELLARGQVRVRCHEVQHELTEELCAHKRYNQGKDQLARITPSETVARSLGRSPDLSSSFTMRMWFTYQKKHYKVGVLTW